MATNYHITHINDTFANLDTFMDEYQWGNITDQSDIISVMDSGGYIHATAMQYKSNDAGVTKTYLDAGFDDVEAHGSLYTSQDMAWLDDTDHRLRWASNLLTVTVDGGDIATYTDDTFEVAGYAQYNAVGDMGVNDEAFVARGWATDIMYFANEPTGFNDSEDVDVAYDFTTRKITLTGSFTARYNGVVVSALTNGWESVAHPAAPTQTQFLYYNGTSFVWTTTPWDFKDIMIAYVLVASDGTVFGALRECHSTMGHYNHREDHNNIGTYLSSGGGLSGYALNSTTPADRRPIVDATVIWDEDCKTTNLAWTGTSYTHGYLTGASSAMIGTTGNAEIMPMSGVVPQWNEFTGGAWQQSDVSVGDFMSMWLISVPMGSDSGSQLFRDVWFQGQNTSGRIRTQRALTLADLDLGEFGNISPEFVIIKQVIIKRTTATEWEWRDVIDIEGNMITSIKTSVIPEHNDTISKQGGSLSLDEYYHLTSDDYDMVVNSDLTGSTNYMLYRNAAGGISVDSEIKLIDDASGVSSLYSNYGSPTGGWWDVTSSGFEVGYAASHGAIYAISGLTLTDPSANVYGIGHDSAGTLVTSINSTDVTEATEDSVTSLLPLGVGAEPESHWSGISGLIEVADSTNPRMSLFNMGGYNWYGNNIYYDGMVWRRDLASEASLICQSACGFEIRMAETGTADSAITGFSYPFIIDSSTIMLNASEEDRDVIVYSDDNETRTGATSSTVFCDAGTGDIGVHTDTPLLNVGSASGDFTGSGIHIKGTSYDDTVYSILDGALETSQVFCCEAGDTNDKLFEIYSLSNVGGGNDGRTVFRSLNDDTSAKTDILTMDWDSGDCTFGGLLSLPANGTIYAGTTELIQQVNSNNYFVGGAGNTTLTGTHNFGTALYAASSLTTGIANISLGVYNLQALTTGNYNFAAGYRAGYSLTGASNKNLFFGADSGRWISGGAVLTSASYGMFFGSGSKASADGNSYEVVMGGNAVGHGSYTFTFGNSSTVSNHFYGDIHFGADNDMLYFGASQDSSITDTGSDMVIDIDELGVGGRELLINNGDVVVDGKVSASYASGHSKFSQGTYGGTPVGSTTLLVENDDDDCYLTIGCPNNKRGGILFADPQWYSTGILRYDHATNSMEIDTNGTTKLSINSTGTLRLFDSSAWDTVSSTAADFRVISGEMWVRDGASNVSQLSPHNKEGEWIYKSRNDKTGNSVLINMEKMIRFLEKYHGKKFIEEWEDV